MEQNISFSQIIAKIAENKRIIILRHVRSDFDACGSQLALKEIIKDNYPDKEVYALGQDDLDCPLIEPMDKIDDDSLIINSLAFILDTSSKNRVDDMRYTMAKDSIRIDHHIFIEKIAAHEFIDPQASSTCAIITRLLRQTDLKVSVKAANYLYAGMSSDSVQFTIAKVKAETFQLCAYLCEKNVQIDRVNRLIYSKSKKLFSFVCWCGQQVRYLDNVGYVIINDTDRQRFNLTISQVKDQVNLMNNIEGVDCWILACQLEGDDYSVSIRSFNIPIDQIAVKYGGGGHSLACGIPHVTYAQLGQLIKDTAAQARC